MLDFVPFVQTEVLPGLNKALWISLKIIVPSALLGQLIGVVVGSLRVYAARPVKAVMNTYVALFRGTPLVVQLYFWYFALPYVTVFGHRLIMDPITCAVVGFALCSGAYNSEYVRGGLLSIKKGQIKAAQALGMTGFQSVFSVVLPQAVRRALPGCGNEVIYLIKYSSLASIITVNEMTGVGRSIAKATWRNTEVFLVVGVYYLVLVTLATLFLSWLERRMALPGFERGKS